MNVFVKFCITYKDLISLVQSSLPTQRNKGDVKVKWFWKVLRFVLWVIIGFYLLETLPSLGLTVPEEMRLGVVIVFAISAYLLSGLIKSLITFLLALLLVLAAIGLVIYWLYISGYLEQILPILPTLPQIFQILESFFR